MRIDVLNGSVSFDAGIISPGIDRATFLESILGRNSRPLTIHGPFASYGFRPEAGIAASVQFQDSRLESVWISFVWSDDSLENWAWEREVKRKTWHDDWLLKELGSPPYLYEWGNVSSGHDSKLGDSEIWITYER